MASYSFASYTVCADVSQFQKPLDKSYGRRVLIFRVTHGAFYLDPNFLVNANLARVMYEAGMIDGVVLYTVYTNDSLVAQYNAVWHAIGPTEPAWLLGIMIDVERWSGTPYELNGNHSARINTLAGMHAHKLGRWSGVLWYGNRGDLSSLYPQRDVRLKGIVASYGTELVYKTVAGAIGQQYTDGQPTYGTPTVNGTQLPRSTQPFGACDHNFFGISSKAFASLLKPAKAPVVVKPVPPKPPVVVPKPPVVVPKPPVQTHPHYDNKNYKSALVSPDGSHALFLDASGNLIVRHNGVTVGHVVLVK